MHVYVQKEMYLDNDKTDSKTWLYSESGNISTPTED